jgi:CBS domain-containing protein
LILLNPRRRALPYPEDFPQAGAFAMAALHDRPLNELVHDQKPVILSPEATVRDACQRMQRRRVGCVMVAEGDRLVGIFTGRDAVGLLAQGLSPIEARLATVMTPAPVSLPPGATAMDALRCMHDGGFRHVPIVHDGRIVGVVSRGDFRAMEHARLDEETGFWERL